MPECSYSEFDVLMVQQTEAVRKCFEEENVRYDKTTFLEDCDICNKQDTQVVVKNDLKNYCRACY